MLKKFFAPACAFGLLLSANALAATCNQLNSGYQAVSQASNNIRNARIQAQATTKIDPWTQQLEVWNEDHCSNGQLFKVGDPAKPNIDPRKAIGSWGGAGGPRGAGPEVFYTYAGDQTYTWKLYKIGRVGSLDLPQVGEQFCWETIASTTAPAEAYATGTVEQVVNCAALASP